MQNAYETVWGRNVFILFLCVVQRQLRQRQKITNATATTGRQDTKTHAIRIIGKCIKIND